MVRFNFPSLLGWWFSPNCHYPAKLRHSTPFYNPWLSMISAKPPSSTTIHQEVVYFLPK